MQEVDVLSVLLFLKKIKYNEVERWLYCASPGAQDERDKWVSSFFFSTAADYCLDRNGSTKQHVHVFFMIGLWIYLIIPSAFPSQQLIHFLFWSFFSVFLVEEKYLPFMAVLFLCVFLVYIYIYKKEPQPTNGP